MPLDRLLSKIAAGGLSAGVFLLWWPEHVPGEGLEQLVLRGLLWTMAFELLLLAFTPLERMALGAVGRRVTAERPRRVRDRLEAAPAPARAGGAVVLAAVGLAGPVALLAGSPHTLIKDADARPRVVKQVIVKRQVVRERVVVRAPAAPAATPSAPAAVPRPVAERTAPRPTAMAAARAPSRAAAPKPARTRPTAAERPAAAQTPAVSAPAPTAPQPAPAASPAAPQP